jgi:translocation and assembly module TamA
MAWARRAVLLCLCLRLFLCLFMAVMPLAALAQAPTYTTRLAPSGDREIDEAIEAGSALRRLQEEPLLVPLALIARARADAERAGTVLRALGYFDGAVTITIDGLALDDPTLPARVQAATEAFEVVLGATPGPRTVIGEATALGPEGAPLTGGIPPAGEVLARALPAGAPARGADILAAETRILAALRNDGFAYARVLPRTLVRDPATNTLSATLRFDPGQRVRIGRISTEGLQRIEPGFVAARLAPRQGRTLTPAELERARRSLLDLGAFAVVRARTAPAPSPDGTADIVFEATERPRRIVSLRGAYATSEGGSVGVSWGHRNLFGRAERLELSGEVNNIAQDGVGDIGYRVGALFSKPDWLRLDQSLLLNAAALREYTDAYDKTSVLGGAALRRRLGERLTGSLGVSLADSRITEGGVTTNYTLLGIPGMLLWNDTSEGLDHVRGSRAEVTVTPYPIAQGSVDGLTTIRVDAAAYRALDREARSVLALRAQTGIAFGASTENVPADLRFYAGGSGTIRGFAFQSVGPLDASGRPLGGTTMLAGSVEFRQRVGQSWGAVGFIDAGGVSGGKAPEWPSRIGTGAGIGVRYYTAIGPIRADIAVPISGKREGDADWQFYFGIGQAF